VTVQGKIDTHALRAEINGGGPELFLRTSGEAFISRKCKRDNLQVFPKALWHFPKSLFYPDYLKPRISLANDS